MFYDRKNVIPEFKIHTSFHYKYFSLYVVYNSHKESFNEKQSFPIQANTSMTLENLGIRPVSISKLNLDLYIFEDASDNQIIKPESAPAYISKPIIIQPGQIVNLEIDFSSSQFINYGYEFVNTKIEEINVNMKNLLTKTILLTLSTGDKISGELIISKS